MNQNLTNNAKPQKHFVIIILFLVAICAMLIPNTRDCFGQSITWQRTYDGVDHLSDGGFGICKADGDNFYVAGYTTISNIKKIYILKLNPYGDTIWTRTFNNDSTHGITEARAIAPSGDGGCVVTGVGTGIFTSKVDQNGNILWNTNYGGGLKQGYSILKTSDGGYIICGRDAECVTDCAYILKIDSIGNFQWQQTYPTGYWKNFNSIIEANDKGGYIAVGFDIGTSNDTGRGYIVKIDYLGNVIWEKRYVIEQGTNINTIQKFKDGYLIAGGSYNASLQRTRLFFGKIDESGDTSGIKIFPATTNEHFGGFGIINENKFVFASSKDSAFSLNGHAFTFDSMGTIFSDRLYLSNDFMVLNSVLPLDNGDILFGGGVDFDTLFTREDVYVLRTDSLLNAPPVIGIINNTGSLPTDFRLHQNYPNPFNPNTIITYEIYTRTAVKLYLYNVNGQLVAELDNSIKQPGKYNYRLNADRFYLASGVYFVKMVTGNGFTAARKIVLVK
jgi:hypothetical protein